MEQQFKGPWNSAGSPLLEAGNVYDQEYYRAGLGPEPYERNERWLAHFAALAEELIRVFRPRTALDAGCAFGMLVEALWDRGVRTRGIDISEYAIAQARPDMRAYIERRSIAEPLGGPFDLAICIEVLEHLSSADSEAAVERLTECSDTVVFSSTPSDFQESTHINVRPPLEWIEQFARHGFAVDVSIDASFVSPHAMVFRRAGECQRPELQATFARLVRERVLADERLRIIKALEHDRAVLEQRHADCDIRLEASAETVRCLRDGLVQRVEEQGLSIAGRVEALSDAVTRLFDRLAELEGDKHKLQAAAYAADLRVLELEREAHQQSQRLGEALAEARKVCSLEARSVELAERARRAEDALGEAERALVRAVQVAELESEVTRQAASSVDIAVNEVVRSPLWRLKRLVRR